MRLKYGLVMVSWSALLMLTLSLTSLVIPVQKKSTLDSKEKQIPTQVRSGNAR